MSKGRVTIPGELLNLVARRSPGEIVLKPIVIRRTRDWCLWLLSNRGIKVGSAKFNAALMSNADPVAFHAANFLALSETLVKSDIVAFYAGFLAAALIAEKALRPAVQKGVDQIARMRNLHSDQERMSDADLRADVAARLTRAQIGEKHGISVSAVGKRMKRLGLKSRKN